MAANEARLPLRLHFDVNKTLIMCDPIQHQTVEDTIALLLAGCVLGAVHDGRWVWDGKFRGGVIRGPWSPV